jgi:translocation and assembly module TamB
LNPRRPGRFRRAVGRTAAAIGLATVFAGSTVGAVALHLDLGPVRRTLRDATNQILAPSFQGRVVVDAIDNFGLHGIQIGSAVVYDPRGEQVLRANGIRAEIHLLDLARTALFGNGELTILVPYLRIEHADISVARGEDQGLALAQAFASRPPTTPPKPKDPNNPDRPVGVALEHVELGHAWIHGEVAPPRAVDAEVTDMLASLRTGEKGLAIDVARLRLLERAMLPAPITGDTNLHLSIETPVDKPADTLANRPEMEGGPKDSIMRVRADFAGRAGGIEVLIKGKLDGDDADATVELPLIKPADLQVLVPGVPLRENASARFALEGTAPAYDLVGRIDITPREGAPGSLTARGKVATEGTTRIDVQLEGRDLDPSFLREDLPKARVSADVNAEIVTAPSLGVVAEVRTQPTEISEQKVPAVDAHAVLDRGELSGTVTVHEPGMPIEGTFFMRPEEGIRFDVEAEIPSLAAAPRLGGAAQGSARVKVLGTLDDEGIDARVDGAVHDIHAGDEFSIAAGRIQGNVKGPLDKLSLNAAISGSSLHAGGYDFDNFTVQARGPALTPALVAKLEGREIGQLDASARIDTKAGAATGIRLRLAKDGDSLEGRADRVAARGGALSVDGFALGGKGLGSIGGTLRVSGNDLTGKLQGKAVDLGRITRLVGIPEPLEGVADLDIDLTPTRGGGHKGHVRVHMEEGVMPVAGLEIPGVSASFSATFDNDKVAVGGLFRLVARADENTVPEERCSGTIAELRIQDAAGEVRGPLLNAKTWSNLTGAARLEAEDWDLRCLARVAPVGMLLSDVRGRLSTHLEVSRAAGQRFVSVRDLSIRTRGLELAGPQSPFEDAPAWASRGIDFAVTGSVDGATGKTSARVALTDPNGLLAEVEGSADLDLATVLYDPRRRMDSIEGSRFSASFSMPRRSMRSFATLPNFVKDKLPPLAGSLQLAAKVEGTVARPKLAVQARGWNVALTDKSGAASPWAMPVDFEALVNYDTKKATVDAHVKRQGRVIIQAAGEAELDLAAIRNGRMGPPRFAIKAMLDEVPLGQIPYFADQGMGGNASGLITLGASGGEPRAMVQLDVPDLQLAEDTFFERASVRIDIDRPEGAATARAVTQVAIVGQGGGRLDATGYVGMRWNGLVPTFEQTQPADFYLRADRFRLAALQPAVAGALDRIDGYLDGGARLGWKRFGGDDKGRVDVNMELTDGAFHVPQLGQELHNAHMSIRSREGGVIRVDDIRADALNGGLRGWAQVKMVGLGFQGARAELNIGQNEELPITFQGVPLGHARGKVELTADKRDELLAIKVRVPDMNLELPATSSRSVQDLEDHPEVALSHAIAKAEEEQERAPDAQTIVATIELGDIHIKHSMADITIKSVEGAAPRLEMTDETRMSGEIKVVRGKFEVLGKKFEIERGLVRLRPEDSSNPYINVTARWDAPDGTRVYVDYIGVLKPINEEKLKFRSDPPLSQQQIFGMVLFNETPDTKGAEAVATAKKAADESPGLSQKAAGAVGGELATAQVNALLSQIAPIEGLRTKIGTTDEGRLRTSVVYQVGDKVTAQASYEGGTNLGGGQGGSPEAQGVRTELSVEWRFRKNWMLRGTLGLTGQTQPGQQQQPSSGLDVLWQYRY